VRRWLPLARRTRTAEEFNFVAGALLGELNASHLGISMRSPAQVQGEPNGRLGVDWRSVPGGFEIAAVVPYGPAAKGPMELLAGDVILAVDGREVLPADTLESSLAGRAGKETLLSVRRTVAGAAKDLRVLVTPVTAGAENELRYDAWTAANEAKVRKLSKDRLGYLHIRQMSQGSLEEFERDLYAAAAGREGLVIDVRNNGGGSTADFVLASLMVQPHAYTVPRGADPSVKTGYPRDRLYIQRYVLPANLLCNEKSFSNAEILAHAFRTLRRGTLVGQETYGGVISTGADTTLDGTVVRTPFRGWFLADGTDMENHGAKPDLLVPQTPEAEARGEDPQLRAAVDDLLKRLR
jgi:tricorn protease